MLAMGTWLEPGLAFDLNHPKITMRFPVSFIVGSGYETAIARTERHREDSAKEP